MSRISVRGFAVASATAVTAVGSVVGVATGSTAQPNDAQATAEGATLLLADIPAGQQADVQVAHLEAQADAQAIAADYEARKGAEAEARVAAAKQAIAKKQAAEREAEQKKADRAAREKADAADFAVQSSYTTAQVQAMARQMVAADQWQCFSNIVSHESGWNYKAVNPSSGAYGLFQALPASKLATAGADWQTNPATQIKWGLNYMESRYGSPCGAWDFWQANHWY